LDTAKLIQTAQHFYAGRFQAVLASHSVEFEGYPFGSTLPYSLDRAGWPLVLLSHLAQHTRNLDKNPKCALTVQEPGEGDIQKQMRLTLIGEAEELDHEDKDLPERYFRYFPEKREFYQEFNFRFYHIRPERFYLVGGFGAARWLGCDRMLLPNPFSAGQENSILKHANQGLAEGLRQHLKKTAPTGYDAAAPVLAVGIDGQGLDLRQGERLFRVSLPQVVATPKEAREILEQMAG
jgi:putative heme iron utilization protein